MKLSNKLLINPGVKEEITVKIRKDFEWNTIKITSYQNLWDAANNMHKREIYSFKIGIWRTGQKPIF